MHFRNKIDFKEIKDPNWQGIFSAVYFRIFQNMLYKEFEKYLLLIPRLFLWQNKLNKVYLLVSSLCCSDVTKYFYILKKKYTSSRSKCPCSLYLNYGSLQFYHQKKMKKTQKPCIVTVKL